MRWCPAICLLLLHTLLSSAWGASRASYTLSQRHTRSDKVILRLINRHTGRRVWQRTVLYADHVGWARDRKALALAVFVVGSNVNFRLLVWQEGKPARLLAGPGRHGGWGAGGYENDGVIDSAWSPDDRRVLFRPWGSGGKDMNVGTLLCLDADRWRLNTVNDSVMRAQWLGPHRIRYQPMEVIKHGSTFSYRTAHRWRYWSCL